MTTNYDVQAIAYTGFYSAVSSWYENGLPLGFLAQAFNPYIGTSESQDVLGAFEGVFRSKPNIATDITGGYDIGNYKANIPKNIFDNARMAETVIGSGTYDTFKRPGINIHTLAISQDALTASSLLAAAIRNDLNAAGFMFTEDWIQTMFDDIYMNVGGGIELKTWEQRIGYQAGIDIPAWSGTPTDLEKADIIYKALRANKSSLGDSGISSKVIVIIPHELNELLQGKYENQFRSSEIITQSPGFAQLSTRNMWMLGDDMIIMPVNKAILNSSGTVTLDFECSMIFQGAVSLAYSPGHKVYGHGNTAFSNNIESLGDKFGIQTDGMSDRSIMNTFMADLQMKMRSVNFHGMDTFSNLIGYQEFEHDSTMNGGKSYNIGFQAGSRIVEGTKARKFQWKSDITPTRMYEEVGENKNYHPEITKASERKLYFFHEEQKLKNGSRNVSIDEFNKMKSQLKSVQKQLASTTKV
jgi:hypothetical protein